MAVLEVGDRGVDGKVGPETWWALRNANGRSQTSGLPSELIPAGIGDGRSRLLEIALGERGIKEVPNGSKLGVRRATDESMAGFIDFWQDARKRRGFERGLVQGSAVSHLGTR